MFSIKKDDKSIQVTRGDTLSFAVEAKVDGEQYIFQPGDVVRLKVTEKKDCETVLLQKDFAVTEEMETVWLSLTKEETRLGDVISKPTDYWYEVELNPFTNPQTIIGFDEEGAKIFRLYPEGKDLEPKPIDPEEIPVVDTKLDLTSERPVENKVVAKAIIDITGDIGILINRLNAILSLKEGSTTGDAELIDIRAGADGHVYESAGEAVRQQFRRVMNTVEVLPGDMRAYVEQLLYSLREQVESAAYAADELVAEITEKLERGEFNGPSGIQGPRGEKGDPGEKGEPGEKGAPGISGICVPTNGMFTLTVDDEGNLWAYYTGENPPQFEIDEEGNLYYIIPVQ